MAAAALTPPRPAALAALVRERRRALGWSQDQLSERAGVAPRTVWRLEQGQDVAWCSLCVVVQALGLQLEVNDGRPAAPPSASQDRKAP